MAKPALQGRWIDRTREARQPVFWSARMRTDLGWSNVIIRNVSSRGFMAECSEPPCRGYFIEVWLHDVCIIAHVVWVRGTRFGARSQGMIDVPSIPDECRRIAAEDADAPGGHVAEPVPSALNTVHPRGVGRAIEYMMVASLGASAALFGAGAPEEVFAEPFTAIHTVLGGGGR